MMPSSRIPFRASRAVVGRRARAASLLLAAGALAGCGGTLRRAFPPREAVFKPVESTLGEPRVVGHDTAYVLAGPGYELYTRDRDELPDAQDALNRAGAAFRRVFGETPTGVIVELRPAEPRTPADTARIAPAGAHPITLRYSPDDDRERRGRYVAPRLQAVPVIRAWLSTRTEVLSGRPAPAPGGTARGRADDPRVADWLEIALPEILTESPRADFVTARLAEAPDRLIPLATLFASARPQSARPDTSAAAERDRFPRERGRNRFGGRRDEAPTLSGAQLFDAEAVSVAQFMRQREGPGFVGAVADAVLRGEGVGAALARATTLPKSVGELDTAYRAWLKSQHDEAASRE